LLHVDAPTYYMKGAFGAPPLSPLLHGHGLIFTSWILLFMRAGSGQAPALPSDPTIA
jgi:hypothetical protein